MIALKLAKAGYFGGDPSAVLQGDVSMVLAAFEYEVFQGDYEDIYYEINKT
jgi:hypothetical protein